MSNKILFVDDDANLLAGCQRTLRKEFSIDTALGGEQALALIEQHGPYAVVVADMQMPGLNGIQFLIKVEERAPDTVRVMLTGNADQKTARDAVNQGHIFRFLTKPCPPEDLAHSLRAGLKQYSLVTAERELLERTLNGAVKTLADILSLLDPSAFGSGQRLRDYVRVFAQSFKITQTWELELAAMLSQIGWVTVPASLREKVRAGHGLTGPEKDILARVPLVAAELLANIPRLEPVAHIVRYQSKDFDGKGSPADAVAGNAIPVGARVLRVMLDLVDLEGRGLTKFKALEKMTQTTGRYDPKVIEAVAAGFDIHIGPESAGEAGMLALTFAELRVNDFVQSDMLTHDGTLIVAAGTAISPTLLEKLRNFSRLSGIKEPIQVTRRR